MTKVYINKEFKCVLTEPIMFMLTITAGSPPRDCDVIKIYIKHTSKIMFTFTCVLSGIGVLFTIYSCLFTYYFRNTR